MKKFESLLFSLVGFAVFTYLTYLGLQAIDLIERRIAAEIERAPR